MTYVIPNNTINKIHESAPILVSNCNKPIINIIVIIIILIISFQLLIFFHIVSLPNLKIEFNVCDKLEVQRGFPQWGQ